LVFSTKTLMASYEITWTCWKWLKRHNDASKLYYLVCVVSWYNLVHGFIPVFLVGSVLLLFLLFLCCVSVFCLSSLYSLCAQFCQCFLLVHSWLPLRFSLILDCLLGFLSFLIASSIFSHSWLPLRFSLILDCLFGFLSFLIVSSVFSHSWLPLRFSLILDCLFGFL
jgi:hypothetical protein